MRYTSLLCLVLALPVHAEVYRCNVDGKVVFSDSKCAKDAQKVEIVPQHVDEENGRHLQQQSQKIKQAIDESLNSPRRTSGHERKIERLEAESAEIRQQMETELAPLRKRRERAKRSDQRWLDQRIEAISARYEARLQENQQLIDGLRARQ